VAVNQYNGQQKKGQIMINKILSGKLKIEQHEPHTNMGVNTGVQEGKAIPAPLVSPYL
jgi:hypothetical protein